MTEVLEHFAEQVEKAFRRILGSRPFGRIEQFLCGRFQIEQVLQVSAAIPINGGMQLEEYLVAPADVANGEVRPVHPWHKTLLQSLRQAAAEEGFVGDAVIEPGVREIELPTNFARRGQEPVRQWPRRDQSAGVYSGQDVDILRRCAAHQPECQQ